MTQLALNFTGKPCLHLFANDADRDLQAPHPGIWRWVCVWCGVQEK